MIGKLYLLENDDLNDSSLMKCFFSYLIKFIAVYYLGVKNKSS